MVKVPLSITIEHENLAVLKEMPLGKQRMLKRKTASFLERMITKASATCDMGAQLAKLNIERDKLETKLAAEQKAQDDQVALDASLAELTYTKVFEFKKAIVEFFAKYKDKPTLKQFDASYEKITKQFGCLKVYSKWSNRVEIAIRDEQTRTELLDALRQEIYAEEHRKTAIDSKQE